MYYLQNKVAKVQYLIILVETREANMFNPDSVSLTENDIDMNVGKRIELRRKLLKMTQKDLAQKIGVTFQQLQKYEQGFNRVSASRLWLISQALGTDINFFFEGVPSAKNIDTDIMQQQKSMELIMSYSKIKNPKVADIIFHLLQEMGH